MIQTKLEWPIRREELLEHLQELSDLEQQLRRWSHDAGDPSNLGFAVNFLFDDTDLNEEPSAYIGKFLYDKDEADAVQAVIRSLDLVFEKHGTDLTDLSYLKTPEWDLVLKAAEGALAICKSSQIA